jgi:hypothetical protein
MFAELLAYLEGKPKGENSMLVKNVGQPSYQRLEQEREA